MIDTDEFQVKMAAMADIYYLDIQLMPWVNIFTFDSKNCLSHLTQQTTPQPAAPNILYCDYIVHHVKGGDVLYRIEKSIMSLPPLI